MTGLPRLDELLAADMGDTGCDFAFEAIDRYVDAQLSGQHPHLHFPGVAAHLLGCEACREDHKGLLAAVRD